MSYFNSSDDSVNKIWNDYVMLTFNASFYNIIKNNDGVIRLIYYDVHNDNMKLVARETSREMVSTCSDINENSSRRCRNNVGFQKVQK